MLVHLIIKTMDSRGSSIFGRASSSEESTSCNQDDYDRTQSYQNHFFDAIRKNPEMGTTLHTSPDALSGDEKTAQNTTNVYFRIPQSSNLSQDMEECDNNDHTSIESTDGSINSNTNGDAQTSTNPFKFKCGIENDEKVNTSKIAQNKEMPQEKILRDNTLITINTITNLLKQLQKLDDKENELMKNEKDGNGSDDTLSKVSAQNQKATVETRKKNRPQMLMKKMKCILSTSNVGGKNENTDIPSTPKSAEPPIEEIGSNMVGTSDNNSLRPLRLEKLQMSKQTLSVVDSLRDSISESMPGVVRRRAQKCSSVSPSPSINGISSDSELPLLLGRCFNLSVNLKILRQCNFADPAIGCRVFVDFDVLDNYLRRKVKECEVSLDIKQSNTEDNLLCPKQLEANINSLSIRNHYSNENIIGCL